MTTKQYKYLPRWSSAEGNDSSTGWCDTEEQVDSFMRDGYLKLVAAFSREKAQEWTKDVWTRLGMEPMTLQRGQRNGPTCQVRSHSGGGEGMGLIAG